MAGRAATDRVIRGRHAISVNDPGHVLPSGWKRVSLGDVADLGTGHTPSRNHSNYWDGGVPWIGIRDAGANHGRVIEETAQTVSDLGLANSAARLLPKDTVCLSRTASVGYVVKMGREMATSQDFVTWSCLDPLDPDYLMSALLAEGQDIRRFGEGSTHTTIYFPEVKAFHIDLPPKAEQRRIVAKLDALTARFARARAELDKLSALAVKQRQSLIRESLQRIAADAPLVRFDDIVDVLTSGSRDWAKYYDRGSSVFVLAGNVRPLFFDSTPKRLVDPPLDGPDARRSRIEKDDLLLTIVGAGTGDICRVPHEFENYFVCQSVARVKLHNPALSSFYAYWFSTPGCGRADVNRVIYGAARPHLSFEHLRNFLVPSVDPLVASRVIAVIETGLARADRLETEAARARALLDRLEAAILAKAFRGELVPQDPNDEPVSVLLDRIRAQRAAAPKAKRGRQKREAA